MSYNFSESEDILFVSLFSLFISLSKESFLCKLSISLLSKPSCFLRNISAFKISAFVLPCN
jgi:hypothetical protein